MVAQVLSDLLRASVVLLSASEAHHERGGV